MFLSSYYFGSAIFIILITVSAWGTFRVIQDSRRKRHKDQGLNYRVMAVKTLLRFNITMRSLHPRKVPSVPKLIYLHLNHVEQGLLGAKP